MAKELVLDVVARKSSRDLQLLALEFDKLAASVDNSNKSAKQSVTFSKFLDDQISETRKQVQQLAQEFERTGSADAFSQFRGAERNLQSLIRIRKQIVDFTGAEKEATQEVSNTDKVLRSLSDTYNNLGADVRKTEQDYKDLTERIKTQTETVRDLQKQARSDNSLAIYARDAAHALDNLKDQAEELKADLAAAPKDASKSFKSFGDFVAKDIQQQRSLIKGLRDDLAKTGNVSLFKPLKDAEGDLKVLESIGKDIGVAVEDGIQKGSQDGIKFLGDAFGSLPPQAQAAIGAGLIAGVALALPTITSLVGAAFIGGAGLGGIGLGIISQIKSPAVVAAIAELKTEATSGLQQAGAEFTPAIVAGAKEAEGVFNQILPEIKENLDKLALPALHLFEGVLGFVRELGPGIDAITSAAAPFVDVLAGELPTFGRALSQMLRDISAGAPGAILAFHDLFLVADATVIGLGKFIEVGEKTFEVLSIISDVFTGKFGQIGSQIEGLTSQQNAAGDSSSALSDELKKLGIDLGNMGGSAKDAASAIDDLNKKYDDLIGKNLSADQAAIQQKQSMDDLAASLKQNGNAWDINTDAGRKNQQALLNAIQAAEQKRQADVANGKDAIQAAQDYNQEVDALLGVAGRAGDAKSNLDKLKGKYEIDVQEYYTTHFINEGTPPSQFFHGLAGGGPVNAGQPYIVGENGPELFMSDTSGTIIPNDVAKKLGSPPIGFRATSAASGSGGGGALLLQAAPGADSLTAQYLHALIDHGVLQVVRA